MSLTSFSRGIPLRDASLLPDVQCSKAYEKNNFKPKIIKIMKNLIKLLTVAAMLFAVGCQKYNDTPLKNRVGELENRVTALEELCKKMNTNISSLQTIVGALQKNDYVTSVTPVTKNGETIGYTIAFSKSAPITIYHGENGKDGANGADGKDGVNGKDGHTPVIGVRQDSDGVYYWTLDGEWLLDDAGNKIKAEGRDGQNGTDGKDGADGKDGITPQLRIENGYWYVSTDNGTTWTNLGKATGEDGKDGKDGIDGDSFFKSVDTTDSEYVVFTLADGTQIKLPTWYAFEQLRTLCNQMNTNISSLQSIVEALQNNDYITSCTPLMENGVQIGYTITFAKSGSIIIYHGKDGVNGADGKDGTDAHSPALGAKKDTDNILYWTLDGEWLTDETGSKIAVHGRDGVDGTDGKDAVAPQLKIEGGYWYVSTDNGATWTNLGKATGEDGKDGANGADGKDGASFFQSVTQDGDYVYLTLTSGEKISVPKHLALSIAFTETEDIRVLADKTYSIGYTITGADDNTVIKALAQDGFRAVVRKTDNATGTIEVTTPSTILPTEILVFVTDGKERTIMRSINFVEGVIIIASNTYTVGYEGGTVEVPLSTNIDYTVEIPEADKSWISLAARQSVVMRDETVVFNIAANNTLTARYSVVKLVDALGITGETILITQKAGSAQELNVATAGSLETIITADKKDTIEELTLTGTFNTFDFDFIRTMNNLRLLDLSGLDNTTLPASCLANSTIATVILPLKLTAIPNRAFYQAAITSIYIPKTVETIGDYAFYQCKSATGNLVIPDATVSIGEYCFTESTFDGTLTLGSGVQTIGQYAFSGCADFTGDLIIPDSVTTLGQYAFNQCGGFSGKVVVGNNVTAVPERAFFECSGLTGTITLGENIESIGDCAFAGCENLTGNLIIPDKVTTIGYNAFLECKCLTGYLSIGSNATNISYGAFAKLEKNDYSNANNSCRYYHPLYFSRVYCKAAKPPTLGSFKISNFKGSVDVYILYKHKEGYAFGNYSDQPTCTLYVPTGCKEAYNQKSGWGKTDYSPNSSIEPKYGQFPTIEEIEF